MIKKIAIFQKKERYTMEQNLTFADLGLSEEILQALEKKGYTFLSAEPAYIPSTYTALPEDAADKMTRLMDLLDDCDDVQGFWHNWEM